MKMTMYSGFATALVVLLGMVDATAIEQNNGAGPDAQALVKQFSQSSSVFIENAGQWGAPEILYALDSIGANVGLTQEGVKFQIFRRVPDESAADPSAPAAGRRNERLARMSQGAPGYSTEMHAFGLVFDQAHAVRPEGRDIADTRFNYTVGDPAKHRSNVPAYRSAWYRGLYSGVDLELTGSRSGVKYNFHLAPGADPSVIRMQYQGVAGISLSDNGVLEILPAVGWQPIYDSAPYIYQLQNGREVSVAGRYVLLDEITCGFEITGAYDSALPLVIDPEITWGRYIGGTASDEVYGVKVDDTGNLHICGNIRSTGWASGGWGEVYGGNGDGFIAKYDSSGSHLWSSYIGGADSEFANALALDDAGNSYVVGATESAGWVSGGWDDVHGGNNDGYVVKINTNGGHVWSTYLGGASHDYGYAVAVDSAGNVHVSGNTYSDGWVGSGWDTAHNGDYDAFAVKLDSNGSHLWSTFMGGTESDESYFISVDDSGNVYCGGSTESDGWVIDGNDTTLGGLSDGFLVKFDAAGTHQWSTYAGTDNEDYGWSMCLDGFGGFVLAGETYVDGNGWDGLLLNLDANGIPQWVRTLGGSDDELVWAITHDVEGNLYVTGETLSSGWVNGGWCIDRGDFSDSFVAKCDNTGTLLWSSYLGGRDDDYGTAIALDSVGDIYAAGATGSNDLQGATWLNSYNGGTWDGYVAKITENTGDLQVSLVPADAVAAGAQWRRQNTDAWFDSGEVETNVPAGLWRIEFSEVPGRMVPNDTVVEVFPGTLSEAVCLYQEGISWFSYLGGTGNDEALDVTIDSAGNVYVAGDTTSAGWISGGWVDTYGGNKDGFIIKFDAAGIHQWSTYLGGNLEDQCRGVALDSSGNLYAAGHTLSSGWTSLGTYGGGQDGFTVKIDAATGSHIWSTYLGGTDDDYLEDVAVDGDGNVYVVGLSWSAGWVSGGWNTTYGGMGDALAVKLASNGAHVWSTYMGGASYDMAYAMEYDNTGNIYIAGATSSAGWVSGGGDTSHNVELDAFLVKLTTAGAHVWSTYAGGTNIDEAYALAIDGSGNVYMAGGTYSDSWVSGGWKETREERDGFIVKMNAAGVWLWSSYIGGTDNDRCTAIVADNTGTLYVVGETRTADWLNGGWDIAFKGDVDLFILKLDIDGNPLRSACLGGSLGDLGTAVALDGSGDVFAAGYTHSTDWAFSGIGASHSGGTTDAFLVRAQFSEELGSLTITLEPEAAVNAGAQWRRLGTETWYDSGATETNVPEGDWRIEFKPVSERIVPEGFVEVTSGHTSQATFIYTLKDGIAWSTYLGGAGEDQAATTALDADGNIYVTGVTTSTGWVEDNTYIGGQDAFIVKLDNSGGHLWSNYLGGAGDDMGMGIKVDASGNIYLAGATESTGWLQNTTWRNTLTCNEIDGFAMKLDSSGVQQWSTYLGLACMGYPINPIDTVIAGPVAIDASGNLYTGVIFGIMSTFTMQSTVFKFDAAGAYQWTMPVGAVGDILNDIVLDGDGNLYVAGVTETADWISTEGWDSTYGGDSDGFLLKVAPDQTLLWSTYLGSDTYEEAYGVAVDAENNVYVAGAARSGIWDGPGTWLNSYDLRGNQAGFLITFTPLGAFRWARYLGGEFSDTAFGVALDGMGNVYVVGQTNSPDWISGGWDELIAGDDGFLAQFNAEGTPQWSSYIGGDSNELATRVIVDPAGAAFVSGITGSESWADGGWIPEFGGMLDGFLLKAVRFKVPAPINPGWGAIENDRITWTWEDTSIQGDFISGFKVYADPGTGPATTMQANTSPLIVEEWTQTGLSANTQYAFQVAGTYYDRDSQKTEVITRYTRCGPPAAGNAEGDNNIIASIDSATITLSNPIGFGTGTHDDPDSILMVTAFRYAWAASTDYIFTGTEPVWNSGDLVLTWPDETSILHVQSLNEEGLSGGVITFGKLRIGQEIVIPAGANINNPVMWINNTPIDAAIDMNNTALQTMACWTEYGGVKKLFAKNDGLLRIIWRGSGIETNPQYYLVLEEGVHTPMPVYHTHTASMELTGAPRVDINNVNDVVIHSNEYVTTDGLWLVNETGVGKFLCARNETWLGVVELRGTTNFIGVQVVELRPYIPDVTNLEYIGQRLASVEEIPVEFDAIPHVARGTGDPAYIYQHNSEGAATHGAVFGVRRTYEAEYLDAEVFWMRLSDAAAAVRNQNIAWPYEMARYHFDWPEDAHDKYHLYVRGATMNDDEPYVQFPVDNFIVELMPYQLFSSGGAFMPHQTEGFYTTGPGWALLKYLHGSPADADFQVVKSVWHDDAAAMATWFSDPSNPAEFTSLDPVPWNVGTEVVNPYHERPAHAPDLPGLVHIKDAAPGEQREDRFDWQVYNGWDGAGEPPLIPDTATGQVIPVNTGNLEVWWYRLGRQGIAWPSLAQRFVADWAEDAVITIADQMGSGAISDDPYANFEIYYQNSDALRGFNPNDEHALVLPALNEKEDKSTLAVFALRSDLGTPETSLPYVLMRYQELEGEELDAYRYRVFKVETGDLSYQGEAGKRIFPPYPLRTTPFAYCEENYGVSGPYWEDRNQVHWARAAGDDGGTATMVMHYYYNVPSDWDFWSPYETLVTGQKLPWLSRLQAPETTATDVAYEISWPALTPEMQYVDTLVKARRGLPAIQGRQSAEIIYQQATALDPLTSSAHLIDYMRYRDADLGPAFIIPPDIATEDNGGVKVFTDLSPALKARVEYDPGNQRLRFKGMLVEPVLGDYYVLLNVMTTQERDELLALSTEPDWITAVGLLYEAADTLVEVENSAMDFVDMALTTGYATGPGYVTLAMENNEDLTSPVSLEIIKVVEDLFPGQIAVIEPTCPFDERVTIKHKGDFAARPDEYFFEWRTRPDETGTPPEDPRNEWTRLETDPPDGRGMVTVTIDEKYAELALTDNWFVCRYARVPESGLLPDPDSPDWSAWTDANIVQGWIKRVVGEINPFTQRASGGGIDGAESSFFDRQEVNTIVSMISQAGPRWNGNVPLNCVNLDGFGLIEIYETVFGRGKDLSIDGVPPINYGPANNALLLAAGRIADLYVLLGNEAFADAADPTIAFGTDDGEYGSQASSIHCFMNITPSLIEEELALLRGQDDTRGQPPIYTNPVYNRLVWNFTNDITGGEVAYALNYNIQDSEGNADGTINEGDAMALYPQGHGDAWGHYLTAIKRYYTLLRHPNFSWTPRAEAVTVGGVAVTVDYMDERKFATAAAARAKAGADIVSLTYRQNYTENPRDQWQGYQDTDSERAWGVGEWAVRAGMGTYFDWVVGNAIIPAVDDENVGVQKIDRTTVPELRDLAAAYPEIEAQVEKADLGLNPLGLATNVVPFDIGPIEIDNQKTHFEQIYDRAVTAMNNTIAVFDYAQNCTQLLRRQSNTQSDFTENVVDQEADFKNRLIEIFGYPYSDDIGGGKTYPQDYDGPDLFHFDYVDPSELMGATPAPVQSYDVEVSHFLEVTDEGTPVKTTQNVTFNLSTSGLGMVKPSDWTGSRRAPGELQLARSSVLQSRARFERALVEYNQLMETIEGQAEYIESLYGVHADEITIMNNASKKQEKLNEAIKRSQVRQLAFRTAAEYAVTVADALSEAMPTSTGMIVGLANGVIGDFTSGIRGAVKSAGALGAKILNTTAEVEAFVQLDHENAKELAEAQTSIQLRAMEQEAAIGEQLDLLGQYIKREAVMRLDLYTQQEALQQTSGRYLAALARGQRLLEERTRFRMRTAGQVQEYRYKDMAFRIFRNEALQKYRAQFDLAARYVYLAAKVYDYETNLLGTHTLAGQRYLNDIVRTRAIGLMQDGQPQITSQGDRGLATPMRQMYDNFTVFFGQFGFNNPQTETNRFGLRGELFRVLAGENGQQAWRDTLEQHVVSDILTLPEFRRYCIPFVPTESTEPGIVIRFSTNINFGQNFFGWPLAGGDSAYDSTNFVTKIRSVGVWFSNYNNLEGGMSNTPRVYLIPIGTDVMRSPTEPDRLTLREWTLVDQRLPVPFALGPGDLDSPSYIPIVDQLSDTFAAVRRFNSFRAYHDSGSFNENEVQSTNSRLIGRSVWNTQWMLIIPAGTLHANREEGIARFIHGPLVDGDRTGEGVTDIKLFFQTYAYAGVKSEEGLDDSNAIVVDLVREATE